MKKQLFLGLFASLMMLSVTSCGESYNGEVMHDAKIMYEKVYVDRDDYEEVLNEYQEYALKHGYGMQRVSDVVREMREIKYGNK